MEFTCARSLQPPVSGHLWLTTAQRELQQSASRLRDQQQRQQQEEVYFVQLHLQLLSQCARVNVIYCARTSHHTELMMYAQQQQQHQQQQSYAYPPGAAAGNQHLIATHMANMGAPVQQLQQFNQAQQQQFQLMHQQHQQQLQQQQQQQQQAFGSSSLDTSAEAANYWGRKYPGVTYTNGKLWTLVAQIQDAMHELSAAVNPIYICYYCVLLV
eukprot:17223-Heterococcus_DN1.PRE.2